MPLVFVCLYFEKKPQVLGLRNHRNHPKMAGGHVFFPQLEQYIPICSGRNFVEQVVLQNFPKLEVGPIGEFNHWDRRECRVQNPEVWKKCCLERLSEKN